MEQEGQAGVPAAGHYGGFWIRFGAMWIDLLCMVPFGYLLLFGERHARLFRLYFLLPYLAFYLFYSVYLVRRYGGTPGKLLLGLRIRKVDESPIGLKEAFLREMPGLIIWIVASVALIVPTLQMTDSQYFTFTPKERGIYIRETAPGWTRTVDIAGQVWVWSEFIVLMTNRKRRALHDFLAGTVVVRVNRPTETPFPRPSA